MTDFDFKVETPEGVTYEPWTDGHAVGFKLIHASGTEEYVYLNPSSDADGGVPNVFVYQGPDGDPAGNDVPYHHYDSIHWMRYGEHAKTWGNPWDPRAIAELESDG